MRLLPSRRRPPNNPPARHFRKAPISSSQPLRGKWTRFETGSSPGFHQREEIEANVFGCYPPRKFKVAPSLGVYRPLFECAALRCAFLVLLLACIHPTRKPSLQGGRWKIRRRTVWEVIASRVRLGDRAATCTCTYYKYTLSTALTLLSLTQHSRKRSQRGTHVEMITLCGDHYLHSSTYVLVSTAINRGSLKIDSLGHLSVNYCRAIVFPGRKPLQSMSDVGNKFSALLYGYAMCYFLLRDFCFEQEVRFVGSKCSPAWWLEIHRCCFAGYGLTELT